MKQGYICHAVLRCMVAALAASASPGQVSARVVIGADATQNMTCSAGICAPTAANAVLNVSDLETLLASGNVTVTTTGTGVQARLQAQMHAAMQKSMGSLFPFGNMEEVGRQNMAMMERAFSLFTPFYRGTEGSDPAQPAGDPRAQEIAQLRAELEALRQQLAATKPKGEEPPPKA